MDHPLGVFARAKYGETVSGGSEGFDSFVRLLAVVEARGHAVNREMGGADEGGRAPFGGFDAIVGFDMPVH